MTDDQDFGKVLPRIDTPVPGPRSRALSSDIARYAMPTSSTIGKGDLPIVMDKAQGANVMDVDGNIYIDLCAGSCVANAGHSNPEIAEAICKQAGRMMHSWAPFNPTTMLIELLEELARLAPGELSVSHVASTGAEAVEAAYKTARIYTQQPGFLAFEGGFHGKLGGALTLTSKNYYRQSLLPLLPEVYHYPFAYCYRCAYGREYPSCDLLCAKYIEQRLDNPDSGLPRIAGLIFEPVLGHGGWIVPPLEFVQELRRITRERDILLIADEIITGFGRTGRWFACEHFGIVPDMLVVGKGMSSGFPISALVTTPEIASAWSSCQHTSTFMGNPLGCAGSLASIRYIEQHDLVQRSAELGLRMKETLQQMRERHPTIGDVRGLGTAVGFEMVVDRKTKEPGQGLAVRVRDECHQRGVAVFNVGGMYGNVFKLSPPLVITDEQLDFAMSVIDESIEAVEKTL
jgi:4-aminobutyrate aminotransferase/(S)-3-amino-2-methylpropionate transaminase